MKKKQKDVLEPTVPISNADTNYERVYDNGRLERKMEIILQNMTAFYLSEDTYHVYSTKHEIK